MRSHHSTFQKSFEEYDQEHITHQILSLVHQSFRKTHGIRNQIPCTREPVSTIMAVQVSRCFITDSRNHKSATLQQIPQILSVSSDDPHLPTLADGDLLN